MSTSLLFGAGAIVTFITLWGVVMAGGLFATRHQPPDDAVDTAASTPADSAPVVRTSESAASPTPSRVVDD